MTTDTLLQMAREGDGYFVAEWNTVVFVHRDGRSWTIQFTTPREARGWLNNATR